MLALSCFQAIGSWCAPKSPKRERGLQQEPVQSKNEEGNVFMFKVVKQSKAEKLGIHSANGKWVVDQVKKGGAIHRTNMENEAKGERLLQVDDTILRINSVEEGDQQMQAECCSKSELVMEVFRPKQGSCSETTSCASSVSAEPAAPLPSEEDDVFSFKVVKQSKAEKLGMHSANGKWEVQRVEKGGAIHRTNMENEAKGERLLQVFDTILRINSVEEGDQQMQAECCSKSELVMHVFRPKEVHHLGFHMKH